MPIKSLQVCDISQYVYFRGGSLDILAGHHYRIHYVLRLAPLFKLRPIVKFTCAAQSSLVIFLIETEFRNPGFQGSMLAATSIL
jgi:hypothetical protein